MIQTAELRRGNLVYDSGNKINVEVDLIGGDSINIVYCEGETSEEIYFEKLEGIALTPEILEKCGFAARSQVAGPTYYEDGRIRIKGKDLELYMGVGDMIRWAEWEADVIYLHQLQNIYFAFWGRELEINL